MTLRLYATPWSRFCGADGWEIAGGQVSDASQTCSVKLYGPEQPGLQCNGRKPRSCSPKTGDGDRYWDPAYPQSIGEHDAFEITSGGQAWSLEVGCLPARAAVVDRESDDCERWLLWQSHRYRSLVGQGSNHPLTINESLLVDGGARREWKSVRDEWQEGDEKAALMALIATFARRKELITAIRAIEQSPRRMLLRKHRMVKVSRVEEMDTVTLRAYARAPGRTAAEKAGPRQELLAVVREDTVDLPENRIFLWLVQRIGVMARSWLAQHKEVASASSTAESIKVLAALSRRASKSERFAEVGALSHHLSNPTYCLQFDRRYRCIWKAYREIRDQDREMDDAFRWQTRLWATTSRLLLASLLQDTGWVEVQRSTPYFRGSADEGEWLRGPSVPGPFRAVGGGICHLIDLRQDAVASQFRGLNIPAAAYASGAECILVWPSQRTLCLVWAAVVLKADDGLPDQEALAQQIAHCNVDSEWRWSGMVMRADPGQGADQSEWVSRVGDSPLFILRFPKDMHRRWADELCMQISLVIEEVLG